MPSNRKRINLRETVTAAGDNPLVVDAGRHVVHDVKILGLESQNGRRYLHEAVRRSLHRYEGVLVNIDHQYDSTNPRRFTDRFGQIVRARMGPDGLRGDLHYNPKHALAESFVWWAKHNPRAIGMSHNAMGDGQEDASGTFVVDEIIEVFSVDLVADPATNKGLFEGRGAGRRGGNRGLARRVMFADFILLMTKDD